MCVVEDSLFVERTFPILSIIWENRISKTKYLLSHKKTYVLFFRAYNG